MGTGRRMRQLLPAKYTLSLIHIYFQVYMLKEVMRMNPILFSVEDNLPASVMVA